MGCEKRGWVDVQQSPCVWGGREAEEGKWEEKGIGWWHIQGSEQRTRTGQGRGEQGIAYIRDRDNEQGPRAGTGSREQEQGADERKNERAWGVMHCGVGTSSGQRMGY